MNFIEKSEIYRKYIEKELKSFLNKNLNNDSYKFIDSLYNSVVKYVLNGGKRLRPILLLYSYESISNNEPNQSIITAALSVELLHNSTLIHDDIMDEDEYRRGFSSIHKTVRDFYFNSNTEQIYSGFLFNKSSSRFAVTHAICAGNILYTLGLSALLQESLDSILMLNTVRVYNESYKIINEGQIIDNFLELQEDVSENQYYNMIINKTAKLFEASVLIGAMLGNANEKQLKSLSEFAFNLGFAFQLQDDLMDLDINKGHELGSDIKKGKKTLLFIKAFANSDEKNRKILNSIWGNVNASDNDIKTVIDLLYKTGAIDYVKRLALSKIQTARSCIGKTDISELSKFFLNGFADSIITITK